MIIKKHKFELNFALIDETRARKENEDNRTPLKESIDNQGVTGNGKTNRR